MKILHTSDWHLGRLLHGRKRTEVYIRFLDWLENYIIDNNIEALLVAGDIFDTNTPANNVLEMYYRFLSRLIHSVCRNIIVIAGNHDSPALLNAPKSILKHFNIHITGSISDNPEDEVIELKNKTGITEAMVCAVPFLRDKDIRNSEAGETISDKETKIIEGIKNHYHKVCCAALQKRADNKIPIIAMGHLFTAGGQTTDDDGVRELYIGSLAHIHHNIFPSDFDYIALGHLHVPQKVNKSEIIRYSGSPLPMGFGEARQTKLMCQLEIKGKNIDIQEIILPVFQKIESIKGNRESITDRINQLVKANEEVIVEVIYTGDEIYPDLKEQIDYLVTDSKVEIIRVKNNRILDAGIPRLDNQETLQDLSTKEVFLRCLQANKIPESEQTELLHTFDEAILLLDDTDFMARI